MKARTIEEIIEQLVPMAACVEWIGKPMKHGYVCTSYKSHTTTIHRILYEYWVGPIPPRHDLHHLCKNKRCCNMDHVEPVTRQKHVHLDDTFAKHHALKTHCPKGHPYEGDNLMQGSSRPGPHRKCRTCMQERGKAKNKGTGNANKTHCIHGHPLSGDNLILERDRATIHRKCRTCRRQQQLESYRRRHPDDSS